MLVSAGAVRLFVATRSPVALPVPPLATDTGRASAEGSAASWLKAAALIEPAATPLAGETPSGLPGVPFPVSGAFTLTKVSPPLGSATRCSLPSTEENCST